MGSRRSWVKFLSCNKAFPCICSTVVNSTPLHVRDPLGWWGMWCGSWCWRIEIEDATPPPAAAELYFACERNHSDHNHYLGCVVHFLKGSLGLLGCYLSEVTVFPHGWLSFACASFLLIVFQLLQAEASWLTRSLVEGELHCSPANNKTELL